MFLLQNICLVYGVLIAIQSPLCHMVQNLWPFVWVCFNYVNKYPLLFGIILTVFVGEVLLTRTVTDTYGESCVFLRLAILTS